MLSHLAILLLLTSAGSPFLPADPQSTGLGVPPVAWGRSALSSVFAPASLVRLEKGECSLFWSETDEGGWYGGCAAGKSWPGLAVGIHAGHLFDSGLDQGREDLTFGGVSVARVVTGSPFGFIEEFFGPSLTVGMGIRASSWREAAPEEGGSDERRTGLDLDCGAQFSVFPTFALGFTGLRLLSLADSTAEASYNYGASYVFNRDLTGHLSWSSGGTGLGFGASLKVSDLLGVRMGTSGEGWSCGASGRISDSFCIDYGLELRDDDTATHALSITCRFGERRAFR